MTKLSYSETDHVLELAFPYNPDLVQRAKTVDGWAWRPRKKCWAYPATLDAVRDLIREFDPACGPGLEAWMKRAADEQRAAERARQFASGAVEAVGTIDVDFHTEPYGHQIDYCQWGALRLRMGLPYRAFFSEQGTGKTKSEIDMTRFELKEGYLFGWPLVVCPEHVQRNWVREIHMHSPPGLFTPQVIKGTKLQKIALLDQMEDIAKRMNTVPVPIIGYAVFSQPSQADVYNALLNMAKSKRVGKVIFDESSMVKNVRSGRGGKAYEFAQECGIRVVMSGTPFPKRPLDVFNPMRILSPGILGVTYIALERSMCEYGGYQGREIVGYKPGALDGLSEKVDRHSFRRLLAECTDLPEEVHVDRFCEMTPEQIRLTENLRQNLLAEMEGENGEAWLLQADSTITQLLRFNQIASGFVRRTDPETGDVQTTVLKKNPKLDLLQAIVTEEIPEEDQFVVWCAYQFDVEKVVERLNEKGVAALSFYGPNGRDKNDANEESFLTGKVRAIVATPDAGGFGLNWQNANWALFYSYGFRWELIDQARARIRRLTQEKGMHFLWLLAENPHTRDSSHGMNTGINGYIKANLDETGEMAGRLTGDHKKDPKSFFRQALEAM